MFRRLLKEKVMDIRPIIAAAFVAALAATQAQASSVGFSSADATFYQTCCGGPFPPSQMIDGTTSGSNGWAVYSGSNNVSNAANALLTLTTPLAAGSYNLTFTIYQNFGTTSAESFHTLGDFSLGYTTDTSPTLSSLQTLVPNQSASSTDASTTFTQQGGGDWLVGGTSPAIATYTLLASISSTSAITGIFLDVFNHSTLPADGPGRQPVNGNFVVSEFALDATTTTPLPSTWLMLLSGFVGLGFFAYRGTKKNAAAIAA